MDKKKKIKALIYLSCAISLYSYLSYDHKYNPEFTIYDNEEEAFARYRYGDVYIGDLNYINSIKDSINEKDILVVCGYQDDNGQIDPNVRVVSSYRIDDKEVRNDILNIILIYKDLYPSQWNRSLESMRVEWTVHNILYSIGYERDRTIDVDLDNSEEELYSNKLLQRIFK